MSLFDKRIAFKPFEYPELDRYKKAIRESQWVVEEMNLTQDVQDFFQITEVERSAMKNAILAIAQIEVNVKTFWGDIGKHIPKPEVAGVGITFGESEVRHADAYSELLEIMGLNREFDRISDIPAIAGRVAYLTKYLETASSSDPKKYITSLILFSLLIENVSLFSQFLILTSFNKYKNTFRGISNVIQATSQEEALHGQFGMAIVNIIREENPEWFEDAAFQKKILDACKKAYVAEQKVLDWIFEKGDLDFLPRDTIDHFIRDRYNKSLIAIGFEPVFEVDADKLVDVQWFDDELATTTRVDFFEKRPTTYGTKLKRNIDSKSLFD